MPDGNFVASATSSPLALRFLADQQSSRFTTVRERERERESERERERERKRERDV